MKLDEFINMTYFDNVSDIYVYDYEDYDAVLDEVEETDKELDELSDAYFIASFRSKMYYKTSRFLKKELYDAEVREIAIFAKRQFAIFIDCQEG